MKCRARTVEDVEKAYREGRSQGIKDSVTFFFDVGLLFLADKCGWREQRLTRYKNFVEKYAEMYSSGDVTNEEIKQILKDEYDIEVKIV